MRHAAVYGARQPVGFELCSQLLEKGYFVYAVDHQLWMREADEERWLYVGRNANLKYFELQNEGDHDKLPFQVPENCCIFIPISDYVMRHVSQVTDQLIQQLTAFSHIPDMQKSCLLLIYPSSTNINQAPLFRRLHSICSELQTNQVPVKDFCPTAQMEDAAMTRQDFKNLVKSFLSSNRKAFCKNK